MPRRVVFWRSSHSASDSEVKKCCFNISFFTKEWLYQLHHHALGQSLPTGVLAKIRQYIADVLGLQVAGHPKLDTKLVWFGCNVLQKIAANLGREELFVDNNVSTRVVGPAAVADKRFPQVRNDSKLVCLCSLPVRGQVVKAEVSHYVLEADMVPVISGFPWWDLQLSCSEETLINPRKLMTAINATSSERAMNQCSSVCCACCIVYS